MIQKCYIWSSGWSMKKIIVICGSSSRVCWLCCGVKYSTTMNPTVLTDCPPPSAVFSLQDLCCRAIVSCTPVHLIDKLPLPVAIKSHLKSFSMANGMNAVMMHGRSYSLANPAGGSKGNSLKRSKSIRPPQSPPQNCTRNNCKIS